MLVGGDEITSVDEIIGKTLYGRADIPIKRIASDAAPSVGSTPEGQAVGVVYSYLLPGSGRSSLYWMFLDDSRIPYYAEHQPGRFSFEALRAQGVKTTEERIQEQIDASKPWEDKLIDAGKWIAIAAVLGYAAVNILPKLFSSQK